LAVTTATFSSSGVITIPATGTQGVATPFPSTINVSNITGNILKLTVTLNTFAHTCPDDVGFLLVGPTGQNIMFLGESGGCPQTPESATLTFDDAAASSMPDTIPAFVSGTYRVSQVYVRAIPGAPAISSATALSVFNGTNPVGTWSLYVNDCCTTDVGTVQSWSLSITTDGTAPVTQFFDPGDNRADPRPGDRLAVYCMDATTIQVIGVGNTGAAAGYVRFKAADVLKAGTSGLSAKLISYMPTKADLGTISIQMINSNGQTYFYVAWNGGVVGPTGQGDFAKQFAAPIATCPYFYQ